MNEEQRVASIFEEHPSRELSTTDVVKKLFAEEYDRIKNSLHDPLSDKEGRSIAQRRKIQLHRKALYYLNKLISDDVLIVAYHKSKGEKIFSLKHKSIVESLRSPHRRIIPKNGSFLSHLDNYHEKKIITGFDQHGWFNRLNAMIIDAPEDKNIHFVLTTIEKVSETINDVIGVMGMERLCVDEDINVLMNMVKKLDIETRDNGRHITLIFDMEKVVHEESIIDFFRVYCSVAPPKINVVCCVTNKYIQNHQRFFGAVIRTFIDSTVKINIQNTDIHPSPMVVGRAGVYTINGEEWSLYTTEVKGLTIGLCLSQISVAVDLTRLFDKHQSPSAFREFIIKLTRSLVESSAQQRRHADTQYRILNNLNDQPHEFYRFAINYIRFWNYDWTQVQQPHILESIETLWQEIADFCATEETIFKSCGIPIRFKVVMSSSFHKFKKDFFSERIYPKMTITTIKDYEKEEVKKYLQVRERLFELFQNADRLRVFRSTPVQTRDVIQEFAYLMTHYNIPLICYDFAKRTEHVTLDKYLQ